MDDIFYTYIYLDPRKSGCYEYGDYKFEYEPIYVGKGCGDRYKRHLECLMNEKLNTYFYRKIRKIKKETEKNPIIQFVSETLTEQEAFKLEIYLIWAIGRSDLRQGVLINHTHGGDGTYGHCRSEESKQKMSESRKGKIPWNKGKSKEYQPMFGKCHTTKTKQKISESNKGQIPWCKGKQQTEETKQKISESNKGKYQTEETKQKISLANKGKQQTEETKIKISETLKGHITTEETKRKISESNKGYITSKETRKKLSESHIGKQAGNKNPMFGKHHSSETKEKISKSHKGKVHTSRLKEKMSKIRKGKIPWNKGKRKFKNL